VTDIFFSYKSVDRDRVRVIHDALTAEGFDVFWDQEVEAGIDWDTWIRNHLTQSKCVLVFWSNQSIESDNVRHEATVAKRQNKLIHALLDPLTAEQFPMGLYTVQAANLTDWKGDAEDAEWKKLCREVEHKLTPLWVKRQIAEVEAELVAERARLAGAQSREKVLQAQIVKEVQAQGDLKQQCDKAVDEATSLKATVEELRRARSKAETDAVELSQSLREAEAQQLAALEKMKQERDKAVDEATSLKATVEELRQARSEAETGPAMLSQPLSETARQQSGISFGGEKLGRRELLAMICGGAMIFLGMILGNDYVVLFWVVGIILLLSGFVMSVIREAKRK
jgi:hypothetical protein